MIKRIITTLFALLFVIIGNIFIRKNRTPHKIMDSIANKLHSIFIFTSFPFLYILWFDISINSTSLNSIAYLILFIQLVIITRYFNQKMIERKELQVKLVKNINKFSLFIFISNWIFLSFGFAILFLITTLLNYIFYIFIINQIKKQKEQAEFKKQFGDGDFTKTDILKKHIVNLFEKELDINQLTKSDIKKQYRTMAKRYHPDVYKGNEDDKFTSINSSYQYLIDYVVK